MPLSYTQTIFDGSTATTLLNDARTFCLDIIRDFYKIKYNSDWHADLDSLVSSGPQNWFLPENKGAFLVLQGEHGDIIAAGGLYDLRRKPSTMTRLASRYGDEPVCQIVRVYIHPSMRAQGLGTIVNGDLEKLAKGLGYRILYLHADAKTDATLGFWSARGYVEFGRFPYETPNGTDTSVDFDKWL